MVSKEKHLGPILGNFCPNLSPNIFFSKFGLRHFFVLHRAWLHPKQANIDADHRKTQTKKQKKNQSNRERKKQRNKRDKIKKAYFIPVRRVNILTQET